MVGQQGFEGEEFAGRLVPGEVDDALSAAAEFLEQPVAADAGEFRLSGVGRVEQRVQCVDGVPLVGVRGRGPLRPDGDAQYRAADADLVAVGQVPSGRSRCQPFAVDIGAVAAAEVPHAQVRGVDVEQTVVPGGFRLGAGQPDPALARPADQAGGAVGEDVRRGRGRAARGQGDGGPHVTSRSPSRVPSSVRSRPRPPADGGRRR